MLRMYPDAAQKLARTQVLQDLPTNPYVESLKLGNFQSGFRPSGSKIDIYYYYYQYSGQADHGDASLRRPPLWGPNLRLLRQRHRLREGAGNPPQLRPLNRQVSQSSR